MINDIMSAPTQIIIFIFSIVLYVCLVSKILPFFLLKPGYKVDNIGDRGLKKYSFENGRAIAYEPSHQAKKYINQYVLSSNNRDKYIKCRIDKRIFSIRYDVVAFDSSDKVITTVQVSEQISTAGISRAAILPAKTAYVTVVVKEVNGCLASDSPKMLFSGIKLASFAASCIALTVIEYLIIRAGILFFADSFFSYSEKFGSSFSILSLALAAAVGLGLAAVIFLFHRTKDTWISK